MPPTRKVSALTGVVTDKQVGQAMRELKTRLEALLTWDKVAYGLGGHFERSYLWQVAMGRRRPSRRLLRALAIIKPEKRTGIRLRISLEDAREIVEHNTVPVDVKNRISYAMWGKS